MKIHQQITQQIIQKLKEGTVPWQSPYLKPMNFLSRNSYRGINRFCLSLSHFKSPYWLTFLQAKQMNWNIRKNEKATTIVFWKMVKKVDGLKEEVFPQVRYYKVFNLDQLENISVTTEAPRGENPIPYFVDYPEVVHGGFERAGYSPKVDKIFMPFQERFTNETSYWQTLCHEMIHSTGHVARLNRFTEESFDSSSHSYGFEELVAEMGASFLASEFGFSPSLDNSASYMQSWLSVLENNPEYILQAASKAENAVDYLLGTEK